MTTEQLLLNIGLLVIQTAVQAIVMAFVVIAVFKATLRRVSVNVSFRNLNAVREETKETKAA